METEVTCPDCGKLIAPPGAVDNMLRCRCAENRVAKNSPDSVSSRPKIYIPITPPDPEPAPAPAADELKDVVDRDSDGDVAGLTITETK